MSGLTLNEIYERRKDPTVQAQKLASDISTDIDSMSDAEFADWQVKWNSVKEAALQKQAEAEEFARGQFVARGFISEMKTAGVDLGVISGLVKSADAQGITVEKLTEGIGRSLEWCDAMDAAADAHKAAAAQK